MARREIIENVDQISHEMHSILQSLKRIRFIDLNMNNKDHADKVNEIVYLLTDCEKRAKGLREELERMMEF